MNEILVNLQEIASLALSFKAGDVLLLNGTIYTARDQAHLRLCTLIDQGLPLPFPLKGAVIYYAGPAAAPVHMPIGSCGPTTSVRMDSFTPKLLELGVAATIGKGGRGDQVRQSIIRNKAPYFCAVGGAGALYASAVKSAEVVAFSELGCESIKRLYVEDFPVIVGIDVFGGSVI